MAAGERRVFGGTVAVDHAAVRKLAQYLCDMHWREYISTGDQLLDRAQSFQILINHQMEKTRRQPQSSHLVALQHLAQLFRRRRALRHDYQSPAVEKAAPDFQRRGIERRRREL